MPVEHHEEFYQRERGLGVAVFVARKRIGAATKNRGRLPLIQREFLADTRDEARIGDGVIGAVRLGGFQHVHFDA